MKIEHVNEYDKAKQVLAETYAKAAWRGEQPDERFYNCYNSLSDCDQLDVDNQAQRIISVWRDWALTEKKSHFSLRTKIILTIVLIGLLSLLWWFLIRFDI